MNNWRLFLFAVLCIFQPISTEEIRFDGKDRCDVPLTRLPGRHTSLPFREDNRKLTTVESRRIKLSEREFHLSKDRTIERLNFDNTERRFLRRTQDENSLQFRRDVRDRDQSYTNARLTRETRETSVSESRNQNNIRNLGRRVDNRVRHNERALIRDVRQERRARSVIPSTHDQTRDTRRTRSQEFDVRVSRFENIYEGNRRQEAYLVRQQSQNSDTSRNIYRERNIVLTTRNKDERVLLKNHRINGVERAARDTREERDTFIRTYNPATETRDSSTTNGERRNYERVNIRQVREQNIGERYARVNRLDLGRRMTRSNLNRRNDEDRRINQSRTRSRTLADGGMYFFSLRENVRNRNNRESLRLYGDFLRQAQDHLQRGTKRVRDTLIAYEDFNRRNLRTEQRIREMRRNDNTRIHDHERSERNIRMVKQRSEDIKNTIGEDRRENQKNNLRLSNRNRISRSLEMRFRKDTERVYGQRLIINGISRLSDVRNGIKGDTRYIRDSVTPTPRIRLATRFVRDEEYRAYKPNESLKMPLHNETKFMFDFGLQHLFYVLQAIYLFSLIMKPAKKKEGIEKITSFGTWRNALLKVK